MESAEQMAACCPTWRSRSLKHVAQACARADIHLNQNEWKIINGDICFRAAELKSQGLGKMRSDGQLRRPPTDCIDLGFSSVRSSHLERIARADSPGERRKELVEFAKAVLDFGASHALPRVVCSTDVGIFSEKIKYVLMAPFWSDLELDPLPLEEGDRDAILTMIHGRLIHWEVEALKSVEREIPASSENRHATRVAKVDEHYGRTGKKGEPYAVFIGRLHVSASEFSAWKRQRLDKCGKQKRRVLDQAADQLV